MTRITSKRSALSKFKTNLEPFAVSGGLAAGGEAGAGPVSGVGRTPSGRGGEIGDSGDMTGGEGSTFPAAAVLSFYDGAVAAFEGLSLGRWSASPGSLFNWPCVAAQPKGPIINPRIKNPNSNHFILSSSMGSFLPMFSSFGLLGSCRASGPFFLSRYLHRGGQVQESRVSVLGLR